MLKYTIQPDLLEPNLPDTTTDFRQPKEARASSSEFLPLASAPRDQCLLGDWCYKNREFVLAILEVQTGTGIGSVICSYSSWAGFGVLQIRGV